MAGQGLMKKLTWKTAPPQYNPRVEGLLEQNDPQPKGAGKIQRKLNKVRFKSRPRKRQRPMPQEDEETDPTIVVSSDEDRQKDQEEEPPQSPPEEEKGNLPYSYTPRSPPYPPPEDNDWDRRTRRKNPLSLPWKKRKEICHIRTPQGHLPTPHLKMMTGETKSLPRLVTPDEDQDTLTTQERKSPEVPANQDANKDFFHDSERQLVV